MAAPPSLSANQGACGARKARASVASFEMAFLPDLARSLNNLANRQGDVEQAEEALETAQEAVRLRRELAERNRDAFLPDLATSCGALGSVRLGMQQYKEAAQAFAEGIRMLVPFIEEHPLVPHIQLAFKLCRDYIEAAKQAGIEPDQRLLTEAIRVLGPYLNQSGDSQ